MVKVRHQFGLFEFGCAIAATRENHRKQREIAAPENGGESRVRSPGITNSSWIRN
jgi:hypothetical protein